MSGRRSTKRSGAGSYTNATVKRSRSSYLNLKNRTRPADLTKTIKKMNDAQKQRVRDMGFGALLNLDIEDVPPKIAYWILENFDTMRGEIVLDGDRRVHISENDVQLIFGFPKGHHPLQF